MTMEERSVWAQLIVFPLAVAVYFAVVLSRAAAMPVEQVSWVVPMLWTMAVLIGGVVAGTIVSAIGHGARATMRGEEPDFEEGDVRDKEIDRYGDHQARVFTSLGVLAAIVLAMVRVDHFWIANLLFLTGVLGAVYAAVVKLRAYRRGF